MSTTLFQHSDSPDPWPLYRERLARWPVIWDADRRLWAVYRYSDCMHVLSLPGMLIPPVPDEGLSGDAQAIKSRLVRISNAPGHTPARDAAMQLFRGRQRVDIAPLMERLLPPPGVPATYDWVERVGRVLPVMHLLAGFGFSDADAAFIQGQLPGLLKLMGPVKGREAAAELEAVCSSVYPLVSQRVDKLMPDSSSDQRAYGVSNLIGLLIQSYDATRGLLSNALVHLLKRETPALLASAAIGYFLSFVTEVMRYDGPVHNTRRVADEDLLLGGQTIAKGQTILIVLAAANRDERKFAKPETFEVHRGNNREMLGFGTGIHNCLAAAYCTELAAAVLCHLFHTYKYIRLEDSPLQYEPLVNVRLVKTMHLTTA